ncbi:MAG: RNA methyltransferase [Clostridia bacterium]|nr:RNA methyltransferase [Clostridia bacterium]
MEWQYISSKSNSLIVRISKLKDKKYRKAEGLFRFDGIKLFYEAATSGAPIEYVLLSESAREKYRYEVEKKCVCEKLYILADDVFSRLTEEQAPEGIVTVCKNLNNITLEADTDVLAKSLLGKRVLMLESVRDVGNMGTIIRSARAFGIDALVISSDCADLYNPKTVRAAMGALFTQRIVAVESISSLVLAMRGEGARVFAAALERGAKKLGEIELKKGDAILIGNEGHGLSAEAISSCDECVYIPMEDGSESLNASIAASVCMWELYKTR